MRYVLIRVPQIAELRPGKALFCLGSGRFNGTGNPVK